MRKLFGFVPVLFLLLSIQSEKISSPEEKLPVHEEKGLELSESEKFVSSSADKFGLKIFKEINKSEGNKNIFISPLSISMALTMTLNGASGSTYEETKSVLELQGMTDEQINQSFKSLIRLLIEADPKVVFEAANSIFSREDFPVEESFTETNRNYFDAMIRELNFSDPASIDTVNNWVKEQTHGKIDKLIDEMSSNLVMLLINAIYFKGTWQYEFNPENTADDIFYLQDGSEKTCRMMGQKNLFKYYEDETLQAVDLPYGDGIYRMTVILPKLKKDLDPIIDNLNESNWNNIINNLKYTDGKVFLPRFKTEYEIKLNTVLETLGMPSAFNPQLADLTRINKNGNLFISFVLHKSFVEVNEEGTEATAVTAVGIEITSPGSGVQPESFYMKADHPFMFVIRENKSNTLLFMGKILDPVN